MERLFDAIIAHFSDLAVVRASVAPYSLAAALDYSHCSTQTDRTASPTTFNRKRGYWGVLLVLCARWLCMHWCVLCVPSACPFHAMLLQMLVCRAVVEKTDWKAAFISKASYNNFISYNKHSSKWQKWRHCESQKIWKWVLNKIKWWVLRRVVPLVQVWAAPGPLGGPQRLGQPLQEMENALCQVGSFFNN